MNIGSYHVYRFWTDSNLQIKKKIRVFFKRYYRFHNFIFLYYILSKLEYDKVPRFTILTK